MRRRDIHHHLRAVAGLTLGLFASPVFAQSDHDLLAEIAAKATAATAARVITVPAGGDAQAAVKAAQCGDTVVLAAGQTFQALTMPVMTCHRWTTVRVSGELPERRVGPADAWQLATVPSLSIGDGTSYWRIIGIRVAPSQNMYGAIRLGNADGHASIESIAHHIELDRVFVDVPDAVQERRGIQVNASDVTIRRCTVHGVKEIGADSQAIGGWDGPGRVVIDDCDLQAAGEVVMFGGSAPSVPGLMASDVTLTNNDISRPLAWKGSPWQIKNLLEIKAGRRFQVRNNRLSNNWVAAQSGFSILFTPRNEAGACPWCNVEDILLEGNTLTNATSGINILGVDDFAQPGGHPATPASRITIRNNRLLVDDRCYQMIAAPASVTFDHNTCIGNGNVLTLEGPKATGFVFTNNVQKHNAYGIIGTGHAPDGDSLAAFFESPILLKNVFGGGTGANYPATNLVPSMTTFGNQFNTDWSLKASSSWKNAGTDGKDLGASIAGAQ